MVEFSVRIDFYRDLEGPKDYVGSALRDGLTTVVLPRVGEHVLGLGPNAWRKGPYGDPYSVVHAVEHRATPAWELDPTKPQEERDPTVMLVFQALWPGDGPLAGPRMLREYDAQGGWQLHFFSDHAPVEPSPRLGSLHPQGALLDWGSRPSDSRILPAQPGHLRITAKAPPSTTKSPG